MYFTSRMRVEGCTSNWRKCNKNITCRNCQAVNKIADLEERIKTLEFQLTDQTQMMNSLVYKQTNPYMEWPF